MNLLPYSLSSPCSHLSPSLPLHPSIFSSLQPTQISVWTLREQNIKNQENSDCNGKKNETNMKVIVRERTGLCRYSRVRERAEERKEIERKKRKGTMTAGFLIAHVSHVRSALLKGEGE